jgi:hypothetical protein
VRVRVRVCLEKQLMFEIAKLLPKCQVDLLNGRQIRKPTEAAQLTDKDKRQMIIQFDYSADPFVRTMLMYGQGLVPELITSAHALKQRQNENMEALGIDETAVAVSSSSGGGNPKTKKKNRK